MDDDSEIITVPEVESAHNGWRLDKYLARVVPELSRARLQQLIKLGCVSLKGDMLTDGAVKIHSGDAYQIVIPPPEDANPEPEDIALDVVYEDEDLIVINKPAGMTVHPAPGAYHGTLVNALLYHCQGNLSGIGGVNRPGIVHRIDKDTSGLLVVAKNDVIHRGLTEQFTVHSIERTYWAFVYGVLEPMNGTIDAPIGRSPYDRKKMAIVGHGGKSAVTHYQTLKMCGRTASLVQCHLETGRTHQIRVHLSSKGCNLIGDQLYVKNKKSLVTGVSAEVKEYINTFPRQALHAQTLGFEHPRTQKWMQFASSLPADLQDLAEILGFEKVIK